MKRLALGVLLVLALAGCGGGDGAKDSKAKPEPPALKAAYDACKPGLEEGLREAYEEYEPPPMSEIFTYDAGSKSLRIVTQSITSVISTFDSAVMLAAAQCVVDETDGPPTIKTEMGAASAQSGPGKDAYDGIRVVWSYDGTSGGSGFTATFSED